MLANIRGRFNILAIAMSVSWSSMVKAKVVKTLERPIERRDRVAKTPRRFKMVKSGVSLSPKATAIEKMRMTCTIPLTMLDRTLDITMEVVEIGAARSLLRKPNLRSQTIDIPLHIEVKRTRIESIPHTMNVK